MSEPKNERAGLNTVDAEDVEVRNIGRGSFLQRFGLMAGLAVVAGGCESSDSADTDSGDPITADTDTGSGADPIVFDSDSGDPADSD